MSFDAPDNSGPELPANLHASLLDSLEEQIAVIDRSGIIIYVNRAWHAFGIENGLATASYGSGSNYLDVCNTSSAGGDKLASEVMRTLQEVLEGKRADFYFEYPCHSPEEKRWFMMRVTPLKNPAENMFVISHHNITQRKLAEETAEHLSLHDPLTGLANRRYLDLFSRNEWRRNYRDRTPVSFIMFDLDHFKDYNDDLGHLAGDQCLVKVAQVLQTYSGRPGDLAVRYGGEEFGLFLGDTGQAQSYEIAERVRKNIYDLDIVYCGTRRMTVSAGVATAVPDREHEDTYLLRKADEALYRSKQAGRNRTTG